MICPKGMVCIYRAVFTGNSKSACLLRTLHWIAIVMKKKNACKNRTVKCNECTLRHQSRWIYLPMFRQEWFLTCPAISSHLVWSIFQLLFHDGWHVTEMEWLSKCRRDRHNGLQGYVISKHGVCHQTNWKSMDPRWNRPGKDGRFANSLKLERARLFIKTFLIWNQGLQYRRGNWGQWIMVQEIHTWYTIDYDIVLPMSSVTLSLIEHLMLLLWLATHQSKSQWRCMAVKVVRILILTYKIMKDLCLN
jgi:hypothetical protein